jgi:hypothetical protein
VGGFSAAIIEAESLSHILPIGLRSVQKLEKSSPTPL